MFKKMISVLILATMVLGMFLFNAVDSYALESSIYKLRSVNYPDRYIRHAYSQGRIDASISPYDDGLWKIRSGLADSSSSQYMSFESVNYPGCFLRHRNGEIWLDQNDGSDLFKQDATWIIRPGLCGSGYSFESYNYRGEYIRHFNSILYRTACTTSLDKQDASFYVPSTTHIAEKYSRLGGTGSLLGQSTSPEYDTFKNEGTYREYTNGSIFYKYGASEAFEIHGDIRNFWTWAGWEGSALGYPTSDEYSVGDRRASRFEGGAIYWRSGDGSWPVMSKMWYGQPAYGKSQSIYVSDPVAFQTGDMQCVITGKGFTPGIYVDIYVSKITGYSQVGYAYVKSDGTFTYRTDSYGTAGRIMNYQIGKVNGYMTFWARPRNGGDIAITTYSMWGVGNNVSLD